MKRFDNAGLFWKDETTSIRGRNMVRAMPPIPQTGWKAPTSFPRLSDAKVLSVDVETYDPDLTDGKGPGWSRGRGHIVGVSIGADSDGRWYFPVRHEVEPETNLEPERVFPWLKYVLNNHNQPKVGANLLYDIGWLGEEGVDVKGDLYDVQFAEALLTETGDVNLDALGDKYLGESKTSNLLYRWCSDYYGGNPTGKQRANIYRAPPSLVGPYAEGDVDLPLKIIAQQWQALSSQNLIDLFERENQLIPLLIAMRREGVLIDIDKAERVSREIAGEVTKLKDKLTNLVGHSIDINSGQSIAVAFDEKGYKYKKTKKGNPSFKKELMKLYDNPVSKAIIEIKELEKVKNVFIDSYLLDSNVNGRIHCQFHPLRGEGYGTRSGRFSSSNPNLQNIPIRDEKWGPLLRGLFIPELEHDTWLKFDASQIEYRFLAHFAVGDGADEVRAAYNENPHTDYHAFTQELIKTQTGIELKRKPTKNINFGFIYGMGKKSLTRRLGLTRSKGESLFNSYHRAVPFAKATMDYFSQQAINLGYVSTIANRRSRFDLYEPIDYWADPEHRPPALPLEKAIEVYGPGIQRAFSHKALNRVLQGSAAELMKETMLQCYESGVFEETGLPKLTVHDELDFSDNGCDRKYYDKVVEIFENAIKISVPVIVDREAGKDWGHVKEVA